MRMHRIQLARPGGSWSPGFEGTTGRKARADDTGRKNTLFMSYFPTVKGTLRMEGLRHYFHKDMALVLDARFTVTAWTAETRPIACECRRRPFDFTPDFLVDDIDGNYAVRLLQQGTTTSGRIVERHQAVDRAYRDEGRFLVVMTAEESSTHPYLPAAKALFDNRRHDWPDDLPGAIAEAWEHECPITLRDIRDSMNGDRESWLQLLSLAALGYLHLDLSCPLDEETLVLACHAEGYRS